MSEIAGFRGQQLEAFLWIGEELVKLDKFKGASQWDKGSMLPSPAAYGTVGLDPVELRAKLEKLSPEKRAKLLEGIWNGNGNAQDNLRRLSEALDGAEAVETPADVQAG